MNKPPATKRPPLPKRSGKTNRPAAKRPDITLRPTGPIVPPGNVSGRALMFVIAIMSFLACLTLGAVMMVQATAATWQSQIAREITIQIKPEDGLDMAVALETARDTALSFPGATDATVLDDAATGRLLEPWLGTGLDLEELPVPRLVIVTIDERSPPDFTAMRGELARRVPSALLDDHRAWVSRLVSMANTTVVIGLSVLALVLAATMLTVVFATRGALSGNRHIVEVLHFIGAEARFVASVFQNHFLMIGLKGATAGGLAAALAFLASAWWRRSFMATPGSDQATALFGNLSMGINGYLGILAVIIVVCIMTTITARITVTRTIRDIDRMRSDAGRIDSM